MIHSIPKSAAIAVVVGLCAGFVGATTIAPPENLAELVQSCDAVVMARAMESQHGRESWLGSTTTRFVLVEQIAGLPVDHEFLVSELGGRRGSSSFVVAGGPSYDIGQVYFLPLMFRSDGTWRSRLLSYGVLKSVQGPEGVVLRPIDEARGLATLSDGSAEPIWTYRQQDLISHLREVGAGRSEWSAATVRSFQNEVAVSSASPDPLCEWMGYRFTRFDSGGSLGMWSEDNGPSNGEDLLQSALARWNAVPSSTIDVFLEGTKDFDLTAGGCSPGGFDESDDGDLPPEGENIVLWDDPCWDIDSPGVDPPNPVVGHDHDDGCSGILAIGGSWQSDNTHSHGGSTWNDAISWIVILDNGSVRCGDIKLQLLLAHELGHGLGFGHYQETSLMSGGCCGEMTGLDETCAQYLYPDEDAPPANPWGLEAVSSESGTVHLGWNDNSTNETGFRIYRSGGSGFDAIGSVGQNARSFTDTGLAHCSQPSYFVRAYNSYGESSASNEETVTVSGGEPDSPTGITIAAPLPSRVELKWSHTGVAADEIRVLRSVEEGPFLIRARLDGGSRSFTDTLVIADTSYRYRLQAANECGESPFSVEVSIVPGQEPSYDPAFEWDPVDPRVGEQVVFTGSSPGDPETWSWDFGDGSVAQGQTAVHPFMSAGDFSVNLTVSGPGGSASVEIVVSVLRPPNPIVAASAHKAGKNGTFWTTNAALTNPGPEGSSGSVRFIAGGGPTDESLPFSLPPGTLMVLDDVVGSMGANATGGLIVEVDTGKNAPVVMSRTFTPGPAGTYGHATPALLPLDSGSYFLTGVRGGPGYRTNFGIAVSADGGASAALILHLPSGRLEGPTLDMPAGSMAQWGIEDIWGEAVLEGVSAATLEVELAGSAVVYIATVDELSGDPAFVSGASPSVAWQIPLIGRSPGKLGTSWDADVMVHNPHSEPTIVDLEWLPADLDNRTGTSVARLTLAPFETRLVENAPKSLWSMETGNGSVLVVSSRSVVVEARSWTPLPNAMPGTMGQRVAPIDLSQVRPVPESLPWVRDDAEVRTNIGLINRSNRVVTIRLELVSASGISLAETEIMLAPRGVSQRSLEFLFGVGVLGEGESGWVRVVSGADSDNEIFASMLANDSGDPIFVLGS